MVYNDLAVFMVRKEVEFRLSLQNNEFVNVSKLSFSFELTNRVTQQSTRGRGFEAGDVDLNPIYWPHDLGQITLAELEVLHP